MGAGPALLRKLARGRERALKGGRQIGNMVFNPKYARSYWPEEQRKSKARVFVELMWWLMRYGEINNYYYVYGLDRKQVRRDDFLPYSVFRRIRNKRNLRTGGAPYNYVCVLRDKFLFAQLLTSLGISTPRAYALLDRDSVTWLGRDATEKLEGLTTASPTAIDGFCKRLDGIQGEGAFPLAINQGKLTVDGQPLGVDGLRAMLGTSRYLLQERIQQHSQISALNASSVNTVRLITFCDQGKARLFSAAMRIGTAGKHVDNWAAGGLIVSIDPDKGALRGEGFFKPGYGGRTAIHPNSGIQFDGFRIPHFEEAVRLVTRLHEYLYGIHSVGWDVAITPAGPTIIEGNDDWEGGIPMVLEQNFRKRFLSMYSGTSKRLLRTS